MSNPDTIAELERKTAGIPLFSKISGGNNLVNGVARNACNSDICKQEMLYKILHKSWLVSVGFSIESVYAFVGVIAEPFRVFANISVITTVTNAALRSPHTVCRSTVSCRPSACEGKQVTALGFFHLIAQWPLV